MVPSNDIHIVINPKESQLAGAGIGAYAEPTANRQVHQTVIVGVRLDPEIGPLIGVVVALGSAGESICRDANGVDDVRAVQRCDTQSKRLARSLDPAPHGKQIFRQRIRSWLMDMI